MTRPRLSVRRAPAVEEGLRVGEAEAIGKFEAIPFRTVAPEREGICLASEIHARRPGGHQRRP
jgi:hypothetical protein